MDLLLHITATNRKRTFLVKKTVDFFIRQDILLKSSALFHPAEDSLQLVQADVYLLYNAQTCLEIQTETTFISERHFAELTPSIKKWATHAFVLSHEFILSKTFLQILYQYQL